LHAGDVRAPADVFRDIYQVFLILGTVVGVVVIAYTLYNAYKYRASRDGTDEYGGDEPQLGEIPSGGGGGRKLFVSFGISALIVLSLIGWTYTTLLYVENTPETDEDPIDIEVVGQQFSWEFVYPNNNSEFGTLKVPKNRVIRLHVTSTDVFHNFGIPELRGKTDAIPGQTTDAWFVAKETGEYAAHCYELCGSGHSRMDATVQVMNRSAYQEWYANTTASEPTANATPNGTMTTTAAPDSANGTTASSTATGTEASA
jgi:cytochrome c oxidase subunit 2